MNEYQMLLLDIFTNMAITVPLMAWFIAQTIKVVLVSIREKTFGFSLYLIPGGFPSSHSAAVTALCTVVAIESGVNSMLFAVTLGLTAFVLYDASVLRRASQKQAKMLNNILESIKLRKEMEPLREVLGHNSFEIFAGSMIGITLAFFMMYVA